MVTLWKGWGLRSYRSLCKGDCLEKMTIWSCLVWGDVFVITKDRSISVGVIWKLAQFSSHNFQASIFVIVWVIFHSSFLPWVLQSPESAWEQIFYFSVTSVTLQSIRWVYLLTYRTDTKEEASPGLSLHSSLPKPCLHNETINVTFTGKESVSHGTV